MWDRNESRFRLIDFDDLVTKFPHKGSAPASPPVEIGSVPSDWDAVLSSDAGLRDLWERKGKTKGDTSPSGYSFDLTRWLVEENRYSDPERLAIMQAHYKHMGELPKSLSSLQTTLGKAKVSLGKAEHREPLNPWSRARSVREFVKSGTREVDSEDDLDFTLAMPSW